MQLPPALISLSPNPSWSNNKVRHSFNQPNRKRLGAKLVNVKHLPHKAFLLDTINKRVANQDWRGTFSPWDNTISAGHQPSNFNISWTIPENIDYLLSLHTPALQIKIIPLSVSMNRKMKKPPVKLNFRWSQKNNKWN